MADPVTDPVAEHDARYGEEGAGPPEWGAGAGPLARPGRLVLDDAAGIAEPSTGSPRHTTNARA
jgi:hypothetical protein